MGFLLITSLTSCASRKIVADGPQLATNAVERREAAQHSNQAVTVTAMTPTTKATTASALSAQATSAPRSGPELPINELLRTNGGCDLPCWWGIQPGVTTWDETKNLLADLPLYRITLAKKNKNAFIVAFREPIIRGLGPLSQFYQTDNGRVTIIETQLNDLEQYELSNILTKYGKPDGIRVATFNAPRDGVLPFRVDLLYLRQGIRIGYSVNARLRGNEIIACMDEAGSSVILTLWSPKDVDALDKLNGRFSFSTVDQLYYLPFDEAVKQMVIGDFYNTYRVNKAKPCLSTLKSLWPPPR